MVWRHGRIGFGVMVELVLGIHMCCGVVVELVFGINMLLLLRDFELACDVP